MKLVEFPRSTKSLTEALEVIDSLRADVEAGKIVAFAAVGIGKDDGTFLWQGNVAKSKTVLQLLGAIEHLKLHFWSGNIK